MNRRNEIKLIEKAAPEPVPPARSRAYYYGLLDGFAPMKLMWHDAHRASLCWEDVEPTASIVEAWASTGFAIDQALHWCEIVDDNGEVTHSRQLSEFADDGKEAA